VQERNALFEQLEIVSKGRAEATQTSFDFLEQIETLRLQLNDATRDYQTAARGRDEAHEKLSKRAHEFDEIRVSLLAEQARERESLIRTLESSRAELDRALDEAAQLQSLRQELSTSQLQISDLQQQMVKRQDEFDYSRSQLISEHAGEYDRLAEALATARVDLDAAKCKLIVQNQGLSLKTEENIRLLGSPNASEEKARIRQVALNQELQLANDELRRVEIANSDFRRQASTSVHVASMERFLFRELAWAAQRVRSSVSGSNLRVLEGGRSPPGRWRC
jgi:chromosome segregation ATPase